MIEEIKEEIEKLMDRYGFYLYAEGEMIIAVDKETDEDLGYING